VEIVKRLLGVRLPLVVTPAQLHRALKRNRKLFLTNRNKSGILHFNHGRFRPRHADPTIRPR
jgi:hypothetical protein